MVQFAFADHTLDTDQCELRRGPEPVAVEPQVFDLLAYLVRNRDRVVTKDDLIASVWGGRIVSESTLTSRIHAARRAVGDSGEEQKLIRTVSRKGLRFIGAVHTPQRPGDGGKSGQAAPAPSGGAARERPLPADRPAIAVLPFVNMTGNPEQEHFSDGVSEDITAALSKLRWFPVVAPYSAFVYKGKAVPMKRVAEELGVSYVVEGSVRQGGRDGERVRFTAQLNCAVTDRQIWAERYDHGLADVLAVQDEISEAIVAAIEPQLYSAESSRTRHKPPNRMTTWDLVMRALSHFWQVTRQDNVVAQALLEKASALDPDHSHALGVLAASHTFAAHMGWAGIATVAPIAERMALAAVRADGEDPWAHHALGAPTCSRGAATTREPPSSRRCGSTRASRSPGATMVWRCPVADAGKKPTQPRAGRCG